MKRWRDEPSRAPSAALALLPAATVSQALPAAAKARSRAAVAKLALHAPAASWLSSSAFKLAAGGLAAVAVTAGVHGATSATAANEAVSAPHLAAAPRPAVRGTSETAFVKNVPDLSSEMAPRAHASAPLVAIEEPAVPVASEPVPAANDDELRRELAILDEARRALASDPQTAFDLAFRHETLHPRGQLWAEREVIAVLALEQLDRCSLAVTRRAALLTRAPSYAARFRTCEPAASSGAVQACTPANSRCP